MFRNIGLKNDGLVKAMRNELYERYTLEDAVKALIPKQVELSKSD